MPCLGQTLFTFTLKLTVLPQRRPKVLCFPWPPHEAALPGFSARLSVKSNFFFFWKKLIKIGEITISAELYTI